MIDYLSKDFYEKMKHDVEHRVSKKRYNHILSVAKTCELVAVTYGLDVRKASLAGILHDWDKGLTPQQEIEKAYEYGLDKEIDKWTINNLPHLLHGPTAAADFLKNFKGFPQDVAHAIYVHTTGCVDMSDLDICLYVSDAIEPNRKYDELGQLRAMVGKATLEELFESVFCLWTAKLILNRRYVEPNTLKVYNSLVMKKQK